MNPKNLKIGTQLKLGVAAMLFLVLVIGSISYYQNDQLHLQTEIMYNHPMKVRSAISMLYFDFLSIQRDMKDMFLTSDEKELFFDINRIETRKVDAFEQIDIIYLLYLGPRTDIDSVKQSFITWHAIHDETIRLLRAGKTKESADRTQALGVGGKQAEIVLSALQKIDKFSKNKSDSLFTTSVKLKDSMNRQLILMVAAILLISLIIYYLLMRNIRKPLAELTDATRRFHNGNMDARSPYTSLNEFGVLSDSFNTLAESIQAKTNLDKMVADLAGLMLSEYNIKKFFQVTLNAMARHTGSQMAAIYLLSDDKKTFDHFESTGVDNNARQSFAADQFEGEFGAVLSSRKVQHIKIVPEDSGFVFHTVTGKFIPREIITIPILADNEIVAIISLANVNLYSKQSIHLIDRILVTLCTRIEGIIANHRMREFSEKVEYQNRELSAQKSELSSQSAELMKQNTELEMQKVQLGEVSRLKTNFLSNMSHELRTPLNSVIALSGVLSRRLAHQIPEEEYSFIEVIARNGKHLLNLINDILDISRIEAGHEETEITKFDLNNLISEVLCMILPEAQQKKVELLQAEGDTDLFMASDAHKVLHILQNLIGNAVKFTEKGRVEVTARKCDNNIAITVTDTGIGISEAHLPHIFDEFRQADGTTSRRFGGTGLGLAIAKKYAALLMGSISVKSIPGKGSEFTLTLPLSHDAEHRIPETEPATIIKHEIKQTHRKPASGSFVKTILLVEDDGSSIIQMKDFLEESGYKILVANNGGEAMTILGQIIPDAMILDLMMPGIDGFELLKTLREAELTVNIPVLILTAKHISKEEFSFLKRNNIHQLIQKGDVNRNELLNTLAAMVFSEIAKTEKPGRELKPIEGKPVVLVVEDNPDSMLTVRALLAGKYAVIDAMDGISGIEIAKKHKPDLILMDIALPEMDGIEAFKIIRSDAHLQHIPVIALIASAMFTDRETILAQGFDAYIAKPIDETKFFKILHETLYGS